MFPAELLPESLRPAEAIDQLSPSDRVFGWVNQSGKGAFRGNVRIGPVRCGSEDSIEWFNAHHRNLTAEEAQTEPGLPLAILGQPKPQQARFYIAASPNGEVQADGLSKEKAGYRSEKGLRGRKVYPHHHSLPPDHWDEPQNDQHYRDAAQSGHAREYTRHPDARDGQGRPNRHDSQNRSIQGWVKPDTEFTFDLRVTNLSRVELGALLWLLDLPSEYYHRFGGGKPLGFGSVRLEIDQSGTQLWDGNGWKEVYSTLDDLTPASTDIKALMNEYREAIRGAYGLEGSFEDVPFIASFLHMAKGFADSLPIHYPRARQQGQGNAVPPHPEGKSYEWFVANDRTGRNSGPRVSLPHLTTDRGLPMLDAP